MDTALDRLGHPTVAAVAWLTLAVAVVPEAAGQAWASLHHPEGGAASRYQSAFIIGGGDAEAVGHCCGPAILHEAAELLQIVATVIADAPGKALYSSGPAQLIASLVQRVEMGPEFAGPTVLVDGCHVLEVSAPDDADALYVRSGAEGTVRGSFFAFADDDGLDLFDVDVLVERCVVRDMADKAISVLEGDATLEDSLVLDSDIGVAVKDKSPSSPTSFTIRRSTIAGHTSTGLLVFDKGGSGAGATIDVLVEDSVLWGNGEAIATDYDPARIVVSHTDVDTELGISATSVHQVWPGFISPERWDYRIGPASPLATASSIGGPLGWPRL